MGSHIEMTANSFQALGTDGLLQSSNFPIRFDLFENFKIFPLEVHAHLACPGHLSLSKEELSEKNQNSKWRQVDYDYYDEDDDDG